MGSAFGYDVVISFVFVMNLHAPAAGRGLNWTDDVVARCSHEWLRIRNLSFGGLPLCLTTEVDGVEARRSQYE